MFRVYLGIFCAVFFWGSAFAGISLALKGYSPESLALGRGLIASFIAAILYSRNRVQFSMKSRIHALFLGVLGIGIYSLFLNIGEKTVPAGVAGFIVGLMPLLAAIFASFFLREKLSRRLSIGLAVSVLGLLLIMIGEPGGLSIGKGLLCVIVSTLSGATYSCFQKPVLKKMSAIPFICHAIWGGTLFLFILAISLKVPFFSEIKRASSTSTLSLFYLGACPSVLAYLGWGYAVSKIDIAKAGVLLYGMPVVGALIAWLILKEVPTPMALSGMGLALLGSLIGTLKIKRKQKLITS